MNEATHDQDLPALLQALCDQRPFAEPVETVEIAQTHISWILLTGDHAYKILKPVDLGFLDFSTLAKRKHCCEEALRLNRRHAPGIYLDVVAITGDESAPRINGDGPVLEYALKMQQFDRESELDKLAERDRLTESLIDKLAVEVAGFHALATTADTTSDAGSSVHVLNPVKENFAQIRSRITDDPDTLARLSELEHWSLSEFEKLEGVFNRRKLDGYVRECHGDMHLGNIVLIDQQPVIFDCIEFSEELRWIDVLNDLAFLIMDLHEHACPERAWRLLNRYLESSGDYAGCAVLPFYLVYRALVRAKVECIRLDQEASRDDATRDGYRRYVELASTFTTHPGLKLFMTCGVSGSGKTSVSQALLQGYGAIRIRSDVERKRLAGLKAEQASGSSSGGGLYSPEWTRRTYARLADLARGLVEAGFPVIVDATFLQTSFRAKFIDLARACRVTPLILHCYASEDCLRRRVSDRSDIGRDASEADVDVLESQLRKFESPGEDEQQYCISIDTEQPLDMDALLDEIAVVGCEH